MAEPVKVKGMRKMVADNMLKSWRTSPVVLYRTSIDVTAMNNFRRARSEKLGRKISANVIFAKAAAAALLEYPAVNGSYVDDMIYQHEDINIGLAVSVPGGLMVPNVKNCDKKSFKEVAEDMDRLIQDTRKGTISLDDMTMGTFTITNMGLTPAVEFTMPIINQPELGILGVYAPKDTPVVENDEIVIRPMMCMSLVADHRIVDGMMAGEFLGRLKELLENPEQIKD